MSHLIDLMPQHGPKTRLMVVVMQTVAELGPVQPAGAQVTSPEGSRVHVRGLLASRRLAAPDTRQEQAVIKELFVEPAVFFISGNLISLPLNIA